MSTSHNFDSLFDTFLSLRNLSTGTCRIYGYSRQRLSEVLNGRDLAEFGPLDASRFALSLVESGLAAATANMYLRPVKTFFRWAVQMEILPKNPFRNVKNFRDTARGRPQYTTAEVDRLISVCPDDRWRLIISLGITTAMRRGEILNLTVDEIDFSAGFIEIHPKSDTARTWAWSIKDAEVRRVPLTPLTERLSLSVLATLPDGQAYVCLPPRRVNHLLTLKRTGRLTYDLLKCPECNFLRKLKRICKWAGVEYRAFHSLRGSCLTLLANNGLQPHDLQAIAGHADFRTTLRHYIRPDQAVEKARKITYIGRYWT